MKKQIIIKVDWNTEQDKRITDLETALCTYHPEDKLCAGIV